MPKIRINIITMTTFKYDSNNTEGAYPTAMVVEDAELKKGNKIVATDIVDLYDTDINNPQDKQALTYVGDKWINGEVTGGGECNVFEGYESYMCFKSVQVDCGEDHSMAIKSDGTLWAAGNNYWGQLGLGDDIGECHVFTQVGTDNDWIQVTCGRFHSVAIKSDGTIWSTGYNHEGQLGLGNITHQNVFTQVGTNNDCIQVTCGGHFTLILKSDGTIWSTGKNYDGQLGLGDGGIGTDRNIFTQESSLSTDWIMVDGGSNHTIALKSDGTIWSTGGNYYGQLGLGTDGNWTNKYNFTQEIGFNNWKQIACGAHFSIVIKSDGTLWGTGRNRDGQLGLGDEMKRNIFTQIGTDTDWVYIFCSVQHSMAIKSNGTLWGTGNNYNGQLGLGDDGYNTDRIVFTKVGTDTDWVQVSGQYYHTIAIKTDKTLWGTGSNVDGKLGLGDVYPNVTLFTQPFINLYNSIFIDQNTTTPGEGQYETPFQSIQDAFQWLRNTCVVIPEDITLSVYLLSDQNIDTPVSLNHPYGNNIEIIGNGYSLINEADISEFIHFSCGNEHSMAIKSDGTLWATGNNNFGQLGLGNIDNVVIFTQVGNDTDWDQVACGLHHTMAIKSDGTLWGTGRNLQGQLGLGDNVNRNIFNKVGTNNDWIQVACGEYYTISIKENGTLWGTGDNHWGQLGLDDYGQDSDRNVFTQEIGLDTNWVQVACGDYHTLAIKSNGTLWGTGTNHYGELGIGGGYFYKIIFTQEESISDKWDQVDCGGNHSISLKSDGTLWSTGQNHYGQLGLGDNVDRNVFTQEIGLDTDWKQVAGGYMHTMAIKSDGNLWCTGYNNLGQLGLGDNTHRNVFTQVGVDNDWIQVACGVSFSLALKLNCNIWDTGNNNSGQLGLGDKTNRNIFNKATQSTDYSNLKLFDNHSLKGITNCKLKNDLRYDSLTYRMNFYLDFLNTPSPDPLEYCTSQVYGDKMYIMKGYSTYIRFYSFDFITKTWDEYTHSSHDTIKPSSCINGNKIYIQGTNNIYVYNIDTDTLSRIGNTTFRRDATMEYNDGKLYIYGGYENVAINSLSIYKLSTNTNETIYGPPENYQGRKGASSGMYNNNLYILGGNYGVDEMGAKSDFHKFNIKTREWTKLQNYRSGNLTQHTSCVIGNKLHVFGGASGEFWVYSGSYYNLDDEDEWKYAGPKNVSSWTQAVRKKHVMSVYKGKMYIHGGKRYQDTVFPNPYIDKYYEAIYIDGVILDENNTSYYLIDIFNLEIKNNSTMLLLNNQFDHSQEKMIKRNIKKQLYSVIYLNNKSIKLYSAVGIFENLIPNNVKIDMNSTVEIPNLEYDIEKWSAKNNSNVIIDTKSNHIIDIENENSTIIVNDAII